MTSPKHSSQRLDNKRLAEAVRKACLQAARQGYESAAMSGLCYEGAMESSLDAIQRLDLEPVMQAAVPAAGEKA